MLSFNFKKYLIAFISLFYASVSFGALTLKVQGIPDSGLVMARVSARVLALLVESDPQITLSGPSVPTVQNIQVRLGETAIPAQYAGETLVFQCDENMIARSQEEVPLLLNGNSYGRALAYAVQLGDVLAPEA